jgi:hypothetical protein
MEERPLQRGDRVEWMGPTIDGGPRHGERGWLVDVHPMDDIIAWDESPTISGAFTDDPEVRRVADRNEPDPEKWLPGDPFGPGEDH